jgi:hypothetical protein
LERALIARPTAGNVMPRTSGVRKLRFAPASRSTGKSGGFRVSYAWFPLYSTIALFLIYPKNEKQTLSADEEKLCRFLVQRMNEALRIGAFKRG